MVWRSKGVAARDVGRAVSLSRQHATESFRSRRGHSVRAHRIESKALPSLPAGEVPQIDRVPQADDELAGAGRRLLAAASLPPPLISASE